MGSRGPEAAEHCKAIERMAKRWKSAPAVMSRRFLSKARKATACSAPWPREPLNDRKPTPHNAREAVQFVWQNHHALQMSEMMIVEIGLHSLPGLTKFRADGIFSSGFSGGVTCELQLLSGSRYQRYTRRSGDR